MAPLLDARMLSEDAPTFSLSSNAIILIVGGSILILVCLAGIPFCIKDCNLPSSEEVKVAPKQDAADDDSSDDDDDDDDDDG